MKTRFKVGDKVVYDGVSKTHKGEIAEIIKVDKLEQYPYQINCKDCSFWVLESSIKPLLKHADKLIFRDNATILFRNGKRYVAKCCDGDAYDKEKGLLVCLAKANGITFRDIQKMLEKAEYQSSKSNIVKQEPKGKFNIGDCVYVTDIGKQYTTYTDWFMEFAPTLKDKYKINTSIDENAIYKIVAMHEHHYRNAMCCAIEDIQGNIYLISQDGIAKAREVKRQAEGGEYIKLTRKVWAFNEVGDILKIKKVDSFNIVLVATKDHPQRIKLKQFNCFDDYLWVYHSEDYVVLENYKPKGANNGN